MNFEKEFGLKQNTKLEVVEKKPAKKEKKQLIDGALATQLEMMMKKNKIEHLDIFENLLSYNTKFFTEEMCETLR
jgi:hypothetical protein